jgi:ubiquinone/menaquinone biosynthesis C-methylase UbiE
MPTQYLLDPAWYAERDRLNSLTQLYDPGTMALIERLGLPPGARCAEIGAGTGSVAELLARHVGPGGQVLAVDTDTRFLDPLADATITVARQDVTATPLPPAQFDLIHARLLLEHLPQRDTVLASLAQGLAPGGWLLIEDLDWATAEVIDPPSPVYNRVTSACREFMRGRGYDPEYARRLPRSLAAAGLTNVGAQAVAVQVRGDVTRGIPQWELLVEQLAPGLLTGGWISQADLESFTALCRDGDSVIFAPLMISSWARQA